eukprot:8430689-Karenia_brevis.AAC.1
MVLQFWILFSCGDEGVLIDAVRNALPANCWLVVIVSECYLELATFCCTGSPTQRDCSGCSAATVTSSDTSKR